jgi:hypothetical protein
VNASPGWATGDRHGWLANLCSLLEAIGAGRHAEAEAGRIRAEKASAYQRSGLFALPMWMWVSPGVAAGRKGRSADGGHLLLPVRLSWPSPTVQVVPAGPDRTYTWSGVGYGRSGRGETTLRVATGPTDTPAVATGVTPPVVLSAPPLPRRLMLTHLDKLTEAGRGAWWEAITLLDPWLHKSLHQAHTQVAIELDGRADTNGRYLVLSEATLDAIANRMLLGSEEQPGTVERMLNACLRQSFERVDPMRYIRTWLRRDATEAIRRDLGDPKQGPKVRRLAMSTGGVTTGEVLAAYKVRYPADEVGIGRVNRALSVSPDPMAERATLDESTMAKRPSTGTFEEAP